MIALSNSLSRYGHNFNGLVSAEYANFNSEGSYSFNVQDPTLEIGVSCNIGIFRGQHPTAVVVEIDAEPDDLKTFQVRQHGNSIVIEQTIGGGNTFIGNVVIGGNGNIHVGGGNATVVMNGQRIEVRNGVTFINGQRVDGSGGPSREPRVRILAPIGASLEASLSGSSMLVSSLPFNRAEVEVRGQSTVGLAAGSIEFKVRGQGGSYLIIGGGDLDITVSGQGNANVQGDFASADVSVSGMGTITTNGKCFGNYRASVSGMGSISHNGTVAGRVKKNLSGLGSIRGLAG